MRPERQKVKATDEASYRDLESFLAERGLVILRQPERLTLVATVALELRPRLVELGGRVVDDTRYTLE